METHILLRWVNTVECMCYKKRYGNSFTVAFFSIFTIVMKNGKQLFLLFVILSSFVSCTVTQRRYMPGSHVQWLGNTTAGQKQSTDNYALIASLDKVVAPIQQLAIHPVLTECDVIFMKDGTEVPAKVLEINSTEIKYKRCDYIDGPTIVINKSDVSQIRYGNGLIELIKSGTNNSNSKANTAATDEEQDYYSAQNRIKPITTPHNNSYYKDYKKKTNFFSIASMVSAIASIFWIVLAIVYFPLLLILVPLPILLGIMALREIRANPDFYKGKGMAIFGIIYGGVMTYIVLMFLALLLII